MNRSIKSKFLLFVVCVFSSYYLYHLWVPLEVTCINQPNSSYTYIIVGAGTAGCVLAARLSENPRNRVLLIEAGGHYNVLSKIPFLAVFLQRSSYDWGYETVPQKWSSRGFYNQKQALPRGKGLGGSNQLNLLIHSGINDESRWELQDTLLKYVRSKQCPKQSQYLQHIFNIRMCMAKCKPQFLFRVQRSNSILADILRRSLKELKHSDLKYYRGDSSIYKGQRWSTYRSHLIPASKRNNLHILCNAEVDKIIFKDRHSIGVQVLNKRIYSESETIISAGSINTPKLLLLSGLGDPKTLQELNVTPVQLLPGVGQNLHDHIGMPVYVKIEQPISLTMGKVMNPNELWNYGLRKQGVFGTSPVGAFLKSSKNFLILFTGATPEDPFRTVANYLPETFRKIFPFTNDYNKEGFVFVAGCKDTKSRGSVKLSRNGTVMIDPQYLQKHKDVECVKNAVSLAYEVLNTTHFKNIGAKVHLPRLTECVDSTLECIIRAAAITTYHQAGTCKMGNDRLSVVDKNFRVRGVTGLRIVDASVLPTPSNNFPNTVVTVLAEYAFSLL